MTVRAIVENGVIKLPADVKLPDGEVFIQFSDDTHDIEGDSAYRIGDDAIDMGVSDLASEHDHYIYGTPKRKKG